jgi:selenocysteine lyase/cysteine desulfurase
MPTKSGLVQPVPEGGARAREAGLFFIVAATQTMGQFPVDARAIGCAALAGTSRKFLGGPHGLTGSGLEIQHDVPGPRLGMLEFKT